MKINLIGTRFGRYEVISKILRNSKKHTYWLCRCDCGNEKEVKTYDLLSGTSKSCGCLHREIMAKMKFIHGESRSNTYQIWENVKHRCLNKNNPQFKDYGGRGITICSRWNKFEYFLEDMGERPENMSIDRIDNSKGYSKENCKWSTMKEQARNKRNNRIVSYKGETHCLSEWCEILKINYSTLFKRLKNWSIEKAFNTPCTITGATYSTDVPNTP